MSNKRFLDTDIKSDKKKLKLSEIEYFLFINDKINYKKRFYTISFTNNETLNDLYENIASMIDQPQESFYMTFNSNKLENDKIKLIIDIGLENNSEIIIRQIEKIETFRIYFSDMMGIDTITCKYNNIFENIKNRYNLDSDCINLLKSNNNVNVRLFNDKITNKYNNLITKAINLIDFESLDLINLINNYPWLLSIIQTDIIESDLLNYAIRNEKITSIKILLGIHETQVIINKWSSNPIVIDNSTRKPKIIKQVNILGQKINPSHFGIIIEIYTDGSVKKTFIKNFDSPK